MPNTKTSKVKVEDIMIKTVFRVTPEMKLREVAELFIKHHIGGAPIVDSLDHVISTIGEGDTIRLAASEGLEATVAHCLPKLLPMKRLITLGLHADFTEAYRIFLKNAIHRIMVVDDSGKLLGLISRSIILQLFVEAHYGKKIIRQAR